MKTISSNLTLSMGNYNENNACNYVYLNICKPPGIIWKQYKKKREFKVPNIKKTKKEKKGNLGNKIWFQSTTSQSMPGTMVCQHLHGIQMNSSY